MNAASRRALRNRSKASLNLRVTVTDGSRTVRFARPVTLRRSAGLRAMARRGLGLWAVCSESCPLRGLLTVSKAQARRAGIKPAVAARVTIATGSATGGATPARLTLRVPAKLRADVSAASELTSRLQVVAGTAPQLDRSATRVLSLRR